jgi:hypothetical protein
VKFSGAKHNGDAAAGLATRGAAGTERADRRNVLLLTGPKLVMMVRPHLLPLRMFPQIAEDGKGGRPCWCLGRHQKAAPPASRRGFGSSSCVSRFTGQRTRKATVRSHRQELSQATRRINVGAGGSPASLPRLAAFPSLRLASGNF